MADNLIERRNKSPESEAAGESEQLLETPEYERKGERSDVESTATLSVLQASFFVVGDALGIGILFIPTATKNIGWATAFILPLIASMLAYTAIALAECWQILRTRFPDVYTTRRIRNPFAVIGYEAFGVPGKILINVSLYSIMEVTGTMSILVAADNTRLLLQLVGIQTSVCYLIPFIYLAITPCSLLGSPKDSWMFAIVGTTTSTIAAVLIICQLFVEYPLLQERKQTEIEISNGGRSIALGLSVLTLSLVSHLNLPNVQQDMKDQSRFSTSAIIGYCAILAVYLPVALGCYYVYGDSLTSPNVMDVFRHTPFSTIINLMITLHVFFLFIYLINPLYLAIESAVGISIDFTWKRAAIRSLVIFGMTFVAATLPSLDKLVELYSASLLPLITIVLPCLFNFKLKMNTSDPGLTKLECVLLPLLTVLGCVAIVVCTYSAIDNFVLEFTLPCYVNASAVSIRG